MAVDIGTGVNFDVGPALAALDKLGLAGTSLRDEQLKSNAAVNQSFSVMAQSATAYSDTLARQQGEYRSAAAAVASARDELRRLTEQQRELSAAQAKTNSTTAEYQRLTKELEKNKQAIIQVKAAINESTQAVREERAAVEQVRESRRQETNAARETAAAAKDAAAAAKQEAVAQKEAASAAGGTAGAATGLSGLIGKIGGVLAGAFVVGKLKQLGGEVVEVTSEFERMEAVLTTIFNGDQGKAERVFAQLRQFTLRNPFEVREVTEGYVKLRNVGINPSIQQLQQLADLAAASGKSFDTVTSGLLGATTGRFAQLKQFGITAKQQGDQVALTFRGVTTVVEKSQDAISSYILGLGAFNGVAGATDRIMKTTGGQITNLKDNFTELFNTIGEGTGGPINNFIKGLSLITKGVNDYFKSDKQRLAEATAGPAQIYADSIDKQFALAAERAKKNGKAVYYAVYEVARVQEAELQKQFDEATKNLNDLTSIDKGYRNSADRAALVTRITGKIIEDPNNEPALRKAEKDALFGQQAYLETVKATQKALKERATIAIKGNEDEATTLGLVAKQQEKIADIVERQKKAQRENAGNGQDYLLGKGGLDEQLKAANKELDRLLGKVDAVKKARQYSYEAQLRALLSERETLTSLAAKAAEQQADDATARAKAVFEEGLRQVEVVRGKLEQRELDLRKAAAKVGGGAVSRLGEKADGVVDGVQDKQLQQLRIASLDKYYEDLYKITRAREQRLFDLREESNTKEVEAINRKYDALLAAQHIGQAAEFAALDEAAGIALDKARQRSQEEIAIEAARQRELLALRASQEQKRIDQTAALGTATAQAVGERYGTGTGISVFEAKRAEARAILEIEKKAAEDSLNNTLNKTGKEAEIERQALRAQLGRIKNQQDELAIQETLGKFSIYKLILGENDNERTRAALDQVASTVVSSLANITAAEEQAAANRVAVSNQLITELTGQLAAQIQLNAAGSASNIKGLQDQIAAEKQARREALDDQRKAAKEKVLIDTLTQASSITTAAAEVFATFAALGPFGVIAGIAATTLLVGSFVAAKAQAYAAAGNIGSGFFKGGYTGGDSKYEERGVVHGQEFVHTAEKTVRYRTLFDALHNDTPDIINWELPQYRALLPRASGALLPDLEMPDKLRAERRAVTEHNLRVSMEPLQGELAAVRAELTDIKASNREMANRLDIIPLPDGWLERDPVTGSTHRKIV
jgi:hypothetical protein